MFKGIFVSYRCAGHGGFKGIFLSYRCADMVCLRVYL